MAEVANPLVPTGEKESRLVSAIRALVATAHSPRGDPQLSHRRAVGTRAGDLLPSGEGGKVLDAEIEPNGWPTSSSNRRQSRHSQRKARVPSFRHPSHSDGADHRRCWERAMPLHLDLADALQGEAVVVNDPA